VEQPGVNAHGEVLEASRVPDCYRGLLLLDPAEDPEGAGGGSGHTASPLCSAAGRHVLYELLTGTPTGNRKISCSRRI
jgi:hypothetical protein